MAYIETWIQTDLSQIPKVHDLKGVLFSSDSSANLIGVEVTDNGEPVVLEGNVKGYVVLSNGVTKKINGSYRNNSKVYIVLTNAVYSVPGPVDIYIKLQSTESGEETVSDKTTLAACRGVIREYTSDTTVS